MYEIADKPSFAVVSNKIFKNEFRVMKKIPLLFLAFGMLIFACKPDSQTTSNDPSINDPTIVKGTLPEPKANPEEEGVLENVRIVDTLTGNFHWGKKPLAALSSAIGANPVIKIDPKKPVPTPPKPTSPQQERIVRVLLSNYWVVQGLVRIRDKEASRSNPGAWFKFQPDGSYTYGYMQNTIGTGAWSLDGQKGTLHLDAPLIGDDREWTLQIAKSEDVMVWVGTERYTTTGTNLKLLNLLFIPKNRKEIGLDY